MRNPKINKELQYSDHLKQWLITYGSDSLNKYKELEQHQFNKPLKFRSKIK